MFSDGGARELASRNNCQVDCRINPESMGHPGTGHRNQIEVMIVIFLIMVIRGL